MCRSNIRNATILFAVVTMTSMMTTARAEEASKPRPVAASQQALQAEAPYLAENDAAMTRMMNDMAVKPTGDADRDFVEMMIPHHQGAIDMAEAILRYGRNEQLRRIAQEIIVDQQQEIAAMRVALGDPLPPSAPAPTQINPGQPTPSSTPNASSMPAGMSMMNMKMGN